MTKKSDGGKGGFSLLGILLHPGVKIFGGIFSLLAAALFGGVQLSRRKKRKATEAEARLVVLHLMGRLQEVRGQLTDFQTWLKKQDQANMDLKETQSRYAGLKSLYAEWTSHEKMEKILGTVQYDPKIGVNVSNGLHELRSLNILMEAVLRDEKLGTTEGARQFAVVNEHLERAIDAFGYVNKDIKNNPEGKA